jgi:hypothetical protein
MCNYAHAGKGERSREFEFAIALGQGCSIRVPSCVFTRSDWYVERLYGLTAIKRIDCYSLASPVARGIAS